MFDLKHRILCVILSCQFMIVIQLHTHWNPNWPFWDHSSDWRISFFEGFLMPHGVEREGQVSMFCFATGVEALWLKFHTPVCQCGYLKGIHLLSKAGCLHFVIKWAETGELWPLCFGWTIYPEILGMVVVRAIHSTLVAWIVVVRGRHAATPSQNRNSSCEMWNAKPLRIKLFYPKCQCFFSTHLDLQTEENNTILKCTPCDWNTKCYAVVILARTMKKHFEILPTCA